MHTCSVHPSLNEPPRDPASSPSSPHHKWLAVGTMDLCNPGRRGGAPTLAPLFDACKSQSAIPITVLLRFAGRIYWYRAR